MTKQWAGRQRCIELEGIKKDIDKLSSLSLEKKKILKLSVDLLLEAFGCTNH